MSSGSWGAKLEQRLSALAESASKESIQALAKWIGFNRKHVSVIVSVLCGALQNKSNSNARQWLYWQVVHEVLVLDVGTPKWERLLDLRSQLGETGVVPAIEALRSTNQLVTSDKLEGLIKQWDDRNVFGGPTLVSQIRRLVTSEVVTTTPKKVPPTSPAAEVPSQTLSPPTAKNQEEPTTGTATQNSGKESSNNDIPLKQEDEGKTSASGDISSPTVQKAEQPAQAEDTMKVDESKPAARRSSLSHVEKEVMYNFEDKGIPYAKVESRDFLTPCKAIATLQIARDLRNDAAVQLSSLLASIPEDIKQVCQEAKDKKDSGDEETVELPPEKARDFSIRINESLLDMDLEEQLQNARTFQDIVERQREARKKLIFLLVQSRCQFGSKEAAEKFYSLEETSKMLKKRKDLLSDAMALEGLDDFDTSDALDSRNELKDLETFAWYKPDELQDNKEDSNKRLKTTEEI